jgi:hypothetical protein
MADAVELLRAAFVEVVGVDLSTLELAKVEAGLDR